MLEGRVLSERSRCQSILGISVCAYISCFFTSLASSHLLLLYSAKFHCLNPGVCFEHLRFQALSGIILGSMDHTPYGWVHESISRIQIYSRCCIIKRKEGSAFLKHSYHSLKPSSAPMVMTFSIICFVRPSPLRIVVNSSSPLAIPHHIWNR